MEFGWRSHIFNTFQSVLKYCKIVYNISSPIKFLEEICGFFLLQFECSISSRYLMSKTKWRIWTPQKFLSVWLINVPYSHFCIHLSPLSLGGQGLLQWRQPWGLAVHQIFLVTHSSIIFHSETELGGLCAVIFLYMQTACLWSPV